MSDQAIIIISFLFFTFLTILPSILVLKNRIVTADTFIQANRSLGGTVAGISAAATGNSGFIMIGAVGMGYAMGISALALSIAWLIGDLIFWNFFAKRLYKYSETKESETTGRLLSQTTNNRIFLCLMGILVCTFLGAYTAGQFIASGKILGVYFNLNLSTAILITSGIILPYILRGGLLSSVWTDFGQALLTTILVVLLLGYGFYINGGFFSTYAQWGTIENYLNPLSGHTLLSLTLFIIGFAIVGFGFPMTQPQITARLLALKDSTTVKLAKYSYIGYLHFTWVGMVIVGMLIKLKYPELPDAEIALPQLSINEFSPIIAGFVLAAVFSTIASTIDSLLVTCGATLSRDVLNIKNKNLSSIR